MHQHLHLLLVPVILVKAALASARPPPGGPGHLALQGRAVALQQNLPAGLVRRLVRRLACPRVLLLARRKRVDLGVDLAAAAALVNPGPPGRLLGLRLRGASGSRRQVVGPAQQLVGALVLGQRLVLSSLVPLKTLQSKPI